MSEVSKSPNVDSQKAYQDRLSGLALVSARLLLKPLNPLALCGVYILYPP
jgi:hypothetical protein